MNFPKIYLWDVAYFKFNPLFLEIQPKKTPTRRLGFVRTAVFVFNNSIDNGVSTPADVVKHPIDFFNIFGLKLGIGEHKRQQLLLIAAGDLARC